MRGEANSKSRDECVCGTMIRMEVNTIQSFLDYFGKIRERTMRVVACIPPDKIEWRAAPDKGLPRGRRALPPRMGPRYDDLLRRMGLTQ